MCDHSFISETSSSRVEKNILVKKYKMRSNFKVFGCADFLNGGRIIAIISLLESIIKIFVICASSFLMKEVTLGMLKLYLFFKFQILMLNPHFFQIPAIL